MFKRPADAPTVNLIKAEGDPLDILTCGNFVVAGRHASGCPVRMDPHAEFREAPRWIVDLLKKKHAEQQAHAAATEARRHERQSQ